MNKQIMPVGGNERIDYLDVVRGIAILGILISNIVWFSLYSPGLQGRFHFGELDRIIGFLQHMFIEGKFYSIFSLLFGWGIAMQMGRFAYNDKNAAKFIRRRMYFMLLFGGIHLLFIWEGDIVFFYALMGFALVLMQRFSNKTLFFTGILLMLSPILLYYLKMNFPLLNTPAEQLRKAGEQIYQYNGWTNQDLSRTDVLRESKSFLSIIWITLADAPYRISYLFFTSRISKILGAMLIGFVIGRSKIYPNVMKHKRRLFTWSIILLIISLPLNFMLAKYMHNSGPYYVFSSGGLLFSIVYALGVFPLSIVYLIFIALIFEKGNNQKIILFFAPLGKMAFSNYILQSLIGIVLFYGIGFGLMEKFGYLLLTILALVIFLMQTIYSILWLKYFRFGPIEWVWRSLTYGKKQPIKNDRR